MWDFVSDEKIVPDDAALKNALPLVNYENVTLEGDQIRFAKDGMGLDFGAIAKGYIADQIKEFLISKGVESAIIDLGGNTLCIGEKPDGSPFHIGIQKPFAERSETIAALEINDKSVVSSGIYERYFEKDGNFYHHILNPKTGYPYDNSLISVTIISDKSVDGDGLSTTCFALGLEKGMELINSLPDVQAVFITDDYILSLPKPLLDSIQSALKPIENPPRFPVRLHLSYVHSLPGHPSLLPLQPDIPAMSFVTETPIKLPKADIA